MDCGDTKERLLDLQRGRLDPTTRERVEQHLAECADCRQAAAREAGLSHALEQALPRYAAPIGLRERLQKTAAVGSTPPSAPLARRSRYAAPVASALASAALVLVVVGVTRPSFLTVAPPASVQLSNEGVNDHLRVLASAHPVEIESGGIHQVKPWFTGRVDFAPRVSFSGDDEFALVGGNVGYFADRKSAVFVFKHRLHTISLFVFRAEGLSWPTRDLTQVGPIHVRAEVARGFTVLLWRDGELGYCLVSDLNRGDMQRLAAKIATAP